MAKNCGKRLYQRVNGERFLEYLRDYLFPALQQGNIVVMNNWGTHKVSGVAS